MGRASKAIVAAREAREPEWFTVTLPKPPSVNSLFRNVTARDGKRGGRVKSKVYATWIAGATYRLLQAKPPRLPAEYVLRIELGRRKGSDLDNYAKGASDLLVSLKIVRDDHLCERLTIEWAGDLASNECRVSIRPFTRLVVTKKGGDRAR